MKKTFTYIIIIFATILGLQSCDHEDITGSSTFYGKINLYPDIVKNGSQVKISMNPTNVSGGDISINISSSTTINGKDVVKSITYYIDDKKVGTGFDKNDGYSVNYTIQNMSAGEYKVTAHCESNFKNYTIDEHFTEATLIVE